MIFLLVRLHSFEATASLLDAAALNSSSSTENLGQVPIASNDLKAEGMKYRAPKGSSVENGVGWVMGNIKFSCLLARQARKRRSA